MDETAHPTWKGAAAPDLGLPCCPQVGAWSYGNNLCLKLITPEISWNWVTDVKHKRPFRAAKLWLSTNFSLTPQTEDFLQPLHRKLNICCSLQVSSCSVEYFSMRIVQTSQRTQETYCSFLIHIFVGFPFLKLSLNRFFFPPLYSSFSTVLLVLQLNPFSLHHWETETVPDPFAVLLFPLEKSFIFTAFLVFFTLFKVLTLGFDGRLPMCCENIKRWVSNQSEQDFANPCLILHVTGDIPSIWDLSAMPLWI